MPKSTVPHGENLRKAIRWLSEQNHLQQKPQSQNSRRAAVENASLLFDLTPLEEEFLFRNFGAEKNNPG